MMKIFLQQLSMATAITLLLCSCGGGVTPNPSSSALSVAITDAPSCGFEHVYVTIKRVRVHESTAATNNDSGWQEITPVLPVKVDLLSLSNGIMMTLGKMPLPAGEYHQLRLVLADNTPGNMANAIVPAGGSIQPLDTISNMQGGLTMMRSITINPQAHTELVLDFDVCRSIVQRGDGSYALRPVLSSTEMHLSGGITGYVGMANAGAAVYAEINGTVIKGTVADSNGRFVLAPIAQTIGGRNYDVVLSRENFSTAIVTGVPVNAGAETVLSSESNPIVLSPAPMQAASGTATPATALATIYAQQEVNGQRYTTRIVNANADTGTWNIPLSNAIPERASFGPLPLNFAANPAEAGHYTISSIPVIGTSQNISINVSAAAATNINVDFCAGTSGNFGAGALCSAS